MTVASPGRAAGFELVDSCAMSISRLAVPRLPLAHVLALALALGPAVGLASGCSSTDDANNSGDPLTNRDGAAGDDAGPGAGDAASDAAPVAPAHGLRADFFDDYSTLASTRYDAAPVIDHDAQTAPAPGVRAFLYSVRWTATLTVDVAGEHTFFANADDGVRVYVDDKAVVDDWNAHFATDSSGKVTLTAGPHALRIEYFQMDLAAHLAITWQPPGGARGPIPGGKLAPLTEAPKDKDGAVLPGPRPLFRNAVVGFDCPDPGVLAVPGPHLAFYMVCTGGKMRVRRSDDLVRWSDTDGFLLPDGKASWSANGGRNWAPEIHKVGAKYVAYYTAVNGADRLSIGAASAPAPEGPYTDRGSALVENALGVIDATFFEDGDGKKYLYWKVDGNSAGQPTPILVRELASDGLSFAPGSTAVEVLRNDPSTWEGGVVEAPWVYEHAGEYFLFYSGNVYDARYRTGVAKATSPKGPFTKKGAPIVANNAQWVGPGHGSVLGVHGRDYYFHHAWPALPGGANDTSKGRYGLVAEIAWTAGWPVIGNGTAVVGDQAWP
ncbi:MAG: glycoside hydrolase, family 43 [Labilithrix sp.]|nr:glycoside hydrolase, family 43 [Labilithrix sp.]